jgi:hypothetical protein
MIRLIMALVLVMSTAAGATAQTPAETWRSFAERLEVGTELKVRLDDGRRVRATLVDVRDDAVVLQPRTRVPVPVQAVAYEKIISLETTGKGIGAGKAVAIGAATGVGAFFGIMAIMVALMGD